MSCTHGGAAVSFDSTALILGSVRGRKAVSLEGEVIPSYTPLPVRRNLE